MYRLYKRKRLADYTTSIEVKGFIPSPVRGLFISGEEKNVKTALTRTYFWLITKGKAQIYYVKSEENKVLHTSYVIPYCYKFPFMSKNDYEIGPCNTILEA